MVLCYGSPSKWMQQVLWFAHFCVPHRNSQMLAELKLQSQTPADLKLEPARAMRCLDMGPCKISS